MKHRNYKITRFSPFALLAVLLKTKKFSAEFNAENRGEKMMTNTKNILLVAALFSLSLLAAIPASAQRPENPQIKLPPLLLPKPVLEWEKFEANVKDYDNKPAAAAITFGFANWEKYSNILFAPSPELPACGANKEAARMFIDIYDFQTDKYLYRWCGLVEAKNIKTKTLYIYPQQTTPKCIYAVFDDRKTGRKISSNSINVKDGTPCVKLVAPVNPKP